MAKFPSGILFHLEPRCRCLWPLFCRGPSVTFVSRIAPYYVCRYCDLVVVYLFCSWHDFHGKTSFRGRNWLRFALLTFPSCPQATYKASVFWCSISPCPFWPWRFCIQSCAHVCCLEKCLEMKLVRMRGTRKPQRQQKRLPWWSLLLFCLLCVGVLSLSLSVWTVYIRLYCSTLHLSLLCGWQMPTVQLTPSFTCCLMRSFEINLRLSWKNAVRNSDVKITFWYFEIFFLIFMIRGK